MFDDRCWTSDGQRRGVNIAVDARFRSPSRIRSAETIPPGFRIGSASYIAHDRITYRHLAGLPLEGRTRGDRIAHTNRQHVHVCSSLGRAILRYCDIAMGLGPIYYHEYIYIRIERHLPMQNVVIISSRTSSGSMAPVTCPSSVRARRSSSAASSSPTSLWDMDVSGVLCRVEI
jgi:hypothetical protein